MNQFRNLEFLFRLEKDNFKSKEDCVVVVLHCLLMNENLQCVGTGEEWPSTDPVVLEPYLPENWNNNQDTYSLRYTSKDKKSRILLKATKVEHVLQVNAVMNEELVGSLPIPVDNYISDEYSEYSSAYKDLESLSKSFYEAIIEKLKKSITKTELNKKELVPRSTNNIPSPLPYEEFPPTSILEKLRNPFKPPSPPSPPHFPRSDPSPLDGTGGSSKAAVPPEARFGPFKSPNRPNKNKKSKIRNPDPDSFPPPDFEDDY